MALSAAVSPLSAQQPAGEAPKYPTFEVHGRMQLQGYAFDDNDLAGTEGGANGPESNFLIRRARIEVLGRISERVSFFIQPSFEAPRNRVRLRDAYVDMQLTKPGASLSAIGRAGQEKRPFGRYELLSSNNLPSIERGAGGGLAIASSSIDLFTANGFLAHDVGVSARAELPVGAHRLEVKGGVYNGQGESFNDINGAKSWGVRATMGVFGKLNVGASYADHETAQLLDPDVPNGPVGPTVRNQGFGLDFLWGAPGAPGLLLIGDYMNGEDTTAARTPIEGGQIVAAWHFRMEHPRALMYALEPVVRADWSTDNADDPDRDLFLFSVGGGLYFSPRTHLRVMWETQRPADDAREETSGFRAQVSASF
jgi:hypothetical protein